jgi:hypothetical protein
MFFLFIWTLNLAGVFYWPSDSLLLNTINALSCCVLTISMWGTWRLHRRLRLQMTGRVFTMVAEPFGLLVVEGPAKEGRDWKITQWRSVKVWDFAGQLFEPTGRGPTVSRAMFNLWGALDSRLAGMPENLVDELLEKLEADLQETFVHPVEDSPEEHVE